MKHDSAATTEFDLNGRVVRTVTGVGTPETAAVAYAYDANGNVTAQTDATGRKVTMAYSKLTRRGAATDALGNTARATYHVRGQRLTATVTASFNPCETERGV